ncbi:hypothetical protein J3R82DRAFT_7900 [Butyriboletus roseoflavus]|nr:hypothetical protein J3R82DRAFT_7900 [Butyriboletus roseoflavus]
MSDPKTLISVVMEGLSDIVVAAGCAPSSSAAMSKVSSQFGDKVSSITSIAGQFSKMIGEVVSADFEVLAVGPSETFEASTMEKDGGDGKAGRTAAGGKVLCTTDLGMRKRVQLVSGKSDTLTLIKSKVVLLDDYV